ncbi:MAG: GNAT family N-acetyltransferase [Nocardioides sp.]|nr:GNAT family N-acetyltransferase [Nocardioides sp.]
MIREATPDDVPALLALERALFGADAWSEALIASALTSDHEHAWVSDDLTAYVVTMVAGDLADLLRIGVAPAHRRRGLAGELFAMATGHARSAGAVRMLLEVSEANEAALGFYAAEGFSRIDERPGYYGDGSDALVLSRALG